MYIPKRTYTSLTKVRITSCEITLRWILENIVSGNDFVPSGVFLGHSELTNTNIHARYIYLYVYIYMLRNNFYSPKRWCCCPCMVVISYVNLCTIIYIHIYIHINRCIRNSAMRVTTCLCLLLQCIEVKCVTTTTWQPRGSLWVSRGSLWVSR